MDAAPVRANDPGALEREAASLSALSARAEAIDPTALSAADRVTRSALIDFLGYERVQLDTGANQPHARALYESAGYRDRPDYNDNPFAAYWGERVL